jgi:hypothetical protein
VFYRRFVNVFDGNLVRSLIDNCFHE